MGHEGGYADDPTDKGGETYRGISRRYHPSWSGWSTIDQYKRKSGFPGNLKDACGLQDKVEAFYKANFWDPMLGDDIPSQLIAEELYDTAVNMGMSRAVKFLQTGLNVLNRAGKNYPDIVVDGKTGPNTLRTLKKLLSLSGKEEGYLFKIMNILQGYHYLRIMDKSESQERFARGWLNRVGISKAPTGKTTWMSNITSLF
jgi:lysozyme family protein